MDEDCTCRDVSAPLIARTWEQHRASGPSRFFTLPAWEAVSPETVLERSCHQQYHGMGLQSGLGRDTAGAQKMPDIPKAAGRGRAVLLGSGCSYTVDFAVDLGAKGSGLMVSKITAIYQEVPDNATVVAPLQLVGKQIFCQLSRCYSDPDISIC